MSRSRLLHELTGCIEITRRDSLTGWESGGPLCYGHIPIGIVNRIERWSIRSDQELLTSLSIISVEVMLDGAPRREMPPLFAVSVLMHSSSPTTRDAYVEQCSGLIEVLIHGLHVP